ncbi:MAG: hypothetical protein V4503_10960 [Gemmatimonadota bacterium]
MPHVRAMALGLVLLGVLGSGGCSSPGPQTGKRARSAQLPAEPPTFGQNSSFTLNGASITLVDGVSSVPIENSSARTTTRYLGREAEGDLNGDGLEDVAFWIAQDAGGSGTFYYVVVALKNPSGYTTTNAFLVGDRIAPESLQVRADARELHVNFLGRARGEPMTAPPSEPSVLLLKVTPDGKLEGLMS